MPAEELLNLFIQNGLVINDDLKASYTEEELQTLFKKHFDMWHIGLSALSHTMYLDLAEQTKAIYDAILEKYIPLDSDMVPIVNIVDLTKTEGLPYDMAEEKFFEDGDNEYYFSGIYSHYVIVHYEDGSQEDIVTALNAGRATIADLDKFDVNYKAKSLGAETAKPDNGTTENVPSFSYEEVNQIYKENDPGVKCDGFYNTSETEVTTLQQVIDRAKNECTIEYDKIDVFYDNVADIWKVVFSTAGTLGGCQTVYLDSKGLTCLIIYGE